jgi:hypothetical protein
MLGSKRKQRMSTRSASSAQPNSSTSSIRSCLSVTPCSGSFDCGETMPANVGRTRGEASAEEGRTVRSAQRIDQPDGLIYPKALSFSDPKEHGASDPELSVVIRSLMPQNRAPWASVLSTKSSPYFSALLGNPRLKFDAILTAFGCQQPRMIRGGRPRLHQASRQRASATSYPSKQKSTQEPRRKSRSPARVAEPRRQRVMPRQASESSAFSTLSVGGLFFETHPAPRPLSCLRCVSWWPPDSSPFVHPWFTRAGEEDPGGRKGSASSPAAATDVFSPNLAAGLLGGCKVAEYAFSSRSPVGFAPFHSPPCRKNP